MAIARKPDSKSSTSPAVDIDALIAKGGTTGADRIQTSTKPQDLTNSHEKENKETCAFTFRIPTSLLAQLDEHRKSQPFKVTRQQWLLSAVVQQLERETSDPKETVT